MSRYIDPMHRVILGAGVVIMEGLTNLGALPRRRVEFAAPFYKIAGTEGRRRASSPPHRARERGRGATRSSSTGRRGSAASPLREVDGEEAPDAGGEVGRQLAVAPAVGEVELGAGVRRERLAETLGVAERDLLVLPAVDEEHRSGQRAGGAKRRRPRVSFFGRSAIGVLTYDASDEYSTP
ncbi:MAG: hypothetical protein AAB328_08925, partial [candidate division NC10 bacterium]